MKGFYLLLQTITLKTLITFSPQVTGVHLKAINIPRKSNPTKVTS